MTIGPLVITWHIDEGQREPFPLIEHPKIESLGAILLSRMNVAHMQCQRQAGCRTH
jgi:hypothetical protein